MAKTGERWHFGIEEGELGSFLEKYSLSVYESVDTQELEQRYFTNASGEIVGRVNGAHCVVRAVKPGGS